MDSSGGEIGGFLLIPIISTLCTLPAALITLYGMETENIILQWAGVPAGIVIGILFGWVFGWVAYQRLEHAGPELLNLMLKGASAKTKSDKDDKIWNEIPQNQKILLYMCQSLFWLPLLPQGLVPLGSKLLGSEEKSWFFALYVPEPFQWPVIFGMIVLGSAMLYVAIQTPRKHRQQRITSDKGE